MGGVALGGAYPLVSMISGELIPVKDQYGYATLHRGATVTTTWIVLYRTLSSQISRDPITFWEWEHGTQLLYVSEVIGHPNDPLDKVSRDAFFGNGYMVGSCSPTFRMPVPPALLWERLQNPNLNLPKCHEFGRWVFEWVRTWIQWNLPKVSIEKMIMFEKIYMGVSYNRGTPNHLF